MFSSSGRAVRKLGSSSSCTAASVIGNRNLLLRERYIPPPVSSNLAKYSENRQRRAIPALFNHFSLYSTKAEASTAAVTPATTAVNNRLEEASLPKLRDAYSAIELALDSVVKIFTVSSSPNYFLPWQNKSQRETMGSVLVRGFFFGVTNFTKCFVRCVFVAKVFSFETMEDLRVVNCAECVQEAVIHL